MADETERTKCSKCGERNLPESKVCWQCGQPLGEEVTESGRDQQPSEPGTEPAPVPVAPEEPVSQQPTPPPAPANNSQTLVILGFIFAGLGLLCCPILPPIAAVIMGIIANSKGNKLGTWVIAAGAIGVLLQATIIVLIVVFRSSMGSGYMPGHMNGMHRY